MRASSGHAAVLALAMTLLAGTDVSAHRTEDYLQAARIGLEPDRVQITLDLTPGIAVAESFLATLDRDRDGSVSADEQREYAGLVSSALEVAIDDKRLQPRVLSSSFAEPAAFRRGGHDPLGHPGEASRDGGRLASTPLQECAPGRP